MMMAFRFLILTLAISATIYISPSSGQITTPCTASMITTFTPCMNFATNSSLNGTTPTSDCCNSLKSLTSTGKDCFCLIATGNVPFQVPINRTLAISLPRACNMPSVPLQCKAVGAPVPAPGPVAISPNAASSPRALTPPETTLAPGADANPDTPTTTTNTGGNPTSSTGNRAGVTQTPSAAAAHLSYSMMSPLLLVTMLGAIASKYY